MWRALFSRACLLLTNLPDLQRYESIINIDLAANFHNFGDVFVVKPENLITAVVLVSIIQGNLDHVTLLQLHLSSAALSDH